MFTALRRTPSRPARGRFPARRRHPFDEYRYRDALRLVAGGSPDACGGVSGGPFDHCGRRILPPAPGMEAAAFRTLLGSLRAGDLSALGNGRPVLPDGTALKPAELGDAVLTSLGTGRYALSCGTDETVQTADGAPYVLDLGQAANERP